MKSIKVNDRKIGAGQPCFIAAEIGLNHNGDMKLSFETIDAAIEAGVDAVKFQNYEVEDFIADKQLTYTYQNEDEVITESQFEMFSRCELSYKQLIEIKEYCDSKNIIFFSTPTGKSGLEKLISLDVKLLKNGSDFLTHLELIEAMAFSGIPTVLSTGMSCVEEIDDAVNTFRKVGGQKLILLHCTSSYPTPPKDINLSRIPVMQEAFECQVGFSDHSEGNAAAVASTVLGACFIEKHFTLDKKLPGPDHWFSSNPKEMKQMVIDIRKAESALGSSRLTPTPSEKKGRKEYRLSCVATRALKAGTRICEEDIKIARPGFGIQPKLKNSIARLVLKKKLNEGQPFEWEHFHF